MDNEIERNPSTEFIPKGLEEIIYASVEKAIQTLLIDQGYLRKRDRSGSRSRSRSRSPSRGRKHHKGRRHGKSRSRSRSASDHGRKMRGHSLPHHPHHFHHHHHFGTHPAELLAEGGWHGHKGGHRGWGKKHHGRRFPFTAGPKNCQCGGGRGGKEDESGDEVVETVDLVDEDVSNADKDLQTGIEKMNVNDSAPVIANTQ